MTKYQEPMPGEIRAVNYIVGEKEGQPLFNHRLEQYFLVSGHDTWPRPGEWVPIRVFQEDEDGTLTEILQ
jgi:hypothetical protein